MPILRRHLHELESVAFPSHLRRSPDLASRSRTGQRHVQSLAKSSIHARGRTRIRSSLDSPDKTYHRHRRFQEQQGENSILNTQLTIFEW